MMNRAILLGRLVRDPELRTTQNGTSVCSFTLAIDRRFKNQY
ncbi:MAG TPA: single-stranded DNA-binding protein, partial [Clostridiaceae bacterium]|nr:single-stranded DNA-binding protein [Clostridiaceae bacterium]